MTAEEALEVIERSATGLSIPELNLFLAKTREDLALFEQEESDERSERSVFRDQRPAFAVPSRYRENADLWLVFSAFVAAFVDPVAQAIDAAGNLEALGGDTLVSRIELSWRGDEVSPVDSLEFSDRRRWEEDLRELMRLGGELGRALFEQDFSLEDFLADRSRDEQR